MTAIGNAAEEIEMTIDDQVGQIEDGTMTDTPIAAMTGRGIKEVTRTRGRIGNIDLVTGISGGRCEARIL